MPGAGRGTRVLSSLEDVACMSAITKWRPEDRPCPVCDLRPARKIGRRGGKADRLHRGLETTVVRCLECDVFYCSPTLIPVSNPYEGESPKKYFEVHDPAAKERIGFELAQFAENALGYQGRILELGCGRGECLQGASRAGWKVCGVEMTPSYAEIAIRRGIEVECTRVEDCESLNRTYDVVLLPAILEHLYTPMQTLRRVYQALASRGLIYVEVPNEGSLTAAAANLYRRLQGRNWAQNLSPTFPPYHVVGFTPKSLYYALDSTGFRIHTLKVNQYAPINLGSGLLRQVERAASIVVQILGAKLGRGDGLECWAIKKRSKAS
jgi:2-polyprenyl-3-methyl-5-hydroxy-6-metoxy-1,4-benzoquinol methylase